MTRPDGAANGHHTNGTDKDHKNELEHDEKVGMCLQCLSNMRSLLRGGLIAKRSMAGQGT